ncbi:hypothetical protein LTR37_001692 [Vermiconidia calcicola]|uniref:Uncharacterized protein n=1 Tax=Vermiconidia calcicola TaxID=1690605 RepID=A0ACC3NUY5_9PEZI|nr:hypothetical protein LTR37_001692 [Vermiconidia calcicola]
MATKRSAPQVHPSRQDQVPNEPKRKRQKPNNAGPKSFKKAHPVNEIKSQIRSIKRLLEKNEGLPANVRIEKERELQTAQHELEEEQKAKKRSDMISRYHKIRFFDRQKATKRLKRAKKELRACEDDEQLRAELAGKVDDAEVDVNYAQYFPLDQHYVSLYPRKKANAGEEGAEDGVEDETAATERKGDAEMWQRVKQCMSDGTLDALRNGKLMGEVDVEREEPPSARREKKVLGKKNAGKGKSAPQPEPMGSDDETGGGFFE